MADEEMLTVSVSGEESSMEIESVGYQSAGSVGILGTTTEQHLNEVTINFDTAVADRRLSGLLRLNACDLELHEENMFVSLTVFCQKWIEKAFRFKKPRDNDARKYVDKVAEIVDAVNDEGLDMMDLVEEKCVATVRETVVNGKVLESVTTNKSTHKIRRGNRSLFAATLANEARVKFGPLRFTEANYIMVRKFLVKLVEDKFPDLRTSDKVTALDRAAFMTLVVSEETHTMMYNLDHTKRGNRILVRFGASE